MRRNHPLLPPLNERFERARGARLAGRLERHCRELVTDCEVRALRRDAGVDLEVGRRGGEEHDLLKIPDIAWEDLASDRSLRRLAEVIAVWIAPLSASVERRSGGASRMAAGS